MIFKEYRSAFVYFLCLHYLVWFWMCFIWVWFFCFVLLVRFNYSSMDDNQDQLRLGKVSEHALVCREKAWPLWPPVDANSFNMDASTSRVWASPTLSFGKGRCHLLLSWKPHLFKLIHFRGALRRPIWLIIVGYVCGLCYQACMRLRGKIYLYLFFEIHVL